MVPPTKRSNCQSVTVAGVARLRIDRGKTRGRCATGGALGPRLPGRGPSDSGGWPWFQGHWLGHCLVGVELLLELDRAEVAEAFLDACVRAGAGVPDGRFRPEPEPGGEVGVVDDTLSCTTRRSGTANRANYSGKLHRHVLHFLAITDDRGRLIWISSVRPGRSHDATAARRDQIMEKNCALGSFRQAVTVLRWFRERGCVQCLPTTLGLRRPPVPRRPRRHAAVGLRRRARRHPGHHRRPR
ncbi:transposase family protein [Streptomyces sp. OM5714]|uniref:transposase family protein n=1 Tax=Streptomyces sp. OM5714 TaxID=2602736 RepID=UPI001F09B37F|nr:transposase family protein [Streptomyces sp. OM5714]